ncbi:MAG: hypothetical protein ACOC4S_00665 [Balneolaceae bacterium]
MSLTFNTLHTHKEFNWDHSQPPTELDHSVEIDENVCPVCGYLAKLDTVDSSDFYIYFKATELVIDLPLLLVDDLSILPVNGRSPPVLV